MMKQSVLDLEHSSAVTHTSLTSARSLLSMSRPGSGLTAFGSMFTFQTRPDVTPPPVHFCLSFFMSTISLRLFFPSCHLSSLHALLTITGSLHFGHPSASSGSLLTGSAALSQPGCLCHLKAAHLPAPSSVCPPCCACFGETLQHYCLLSVFSSLNMTQVNTCLKRTFTIFNIFFAIVGGAIIALALLSQVLTNVNGGDKLEGRTAGLIVLYVVGSVTMVIAILGAYGAHRESKVCLIVFLVCMVSGSLLMLRAGIPAAVARPQLEGVLEDKFRELLPLDKASQEVKNMAESMQSQLHCCGLFGYEDWEQNIPDSCLCSQQEEMEGKCQTVSYRFLMMPRKSVYIKTCFPFIMYYVLLVADIMIGVVFTLAVLALLGMVLSSIMIHQMRYPNRPTVLLSVPAIFTTPPPKYQELHNPPQY